MELATRTIVCIGLLAAMASGQNLDPDTIAGMDAEVRGDWIRAVEAFGRVIAKPEPSRLARQRYRAAKKRALAVYNEEMKRLLKAKKWPELADCAACLRLIDPKSSFVKRALKACEKQGVAVPNIPPEQEGAVDAFPHRSPGGRARSLASLEARTKATEIIRGCHAFLAKSQTKDGRWDCDAHEGAALYDVGVTSLALLALLSEGPAALEGPYAGNIEKGIKFLLESKSDGGYLGPTVSNHFIYIHAIATTALAEYAIVSDKVLAHRKTLTAARNALLSHQAPGKGWGYEPIKGPLDMSVTAWCALALARIDLAGIPAPESAYQGALAQIARFTDPEFGQVGYNHPGGASARTTDSFKKFPVEHTQAMTAAACLVRAVIAPDAFAESAKGFAMITEIPPMAEYPDMYYWYHGTHAFQASRGTVPSSWYTTVVDSMTPHIDASGKVRAAGPWGQNEGGAIYATAICALALAAPYRENGPPIGRGKTASAFFRTGSRTVPLLGRRQHATTGIYVDKGTKWNIRATGTLRAHKRAPLVSARGVSRGGGTPLFKGHPYGCLLGRVGPDGKLFRMPAEGKSWVARGSGHLVFFQNAKVKNGAGGAWTIEISLER